MGPIRMRASVAFEFEGERLRVGQAFFTSAINAAALRYQGKADFAGPPTITRATQAEEPEPAAEPALAAAEAPEADAQDSSRRRGTYRRRDLRAEGSSPASKD